MGAAGCMRELSCAVILLLRPWRAMVGACVRSASAMNRRRCGPGVRSVGRSMVEVWRRRLSSQVVCDVCHPSHRECAMRTAAGTLKLAYRRA